MVEGQVSKNLRRSSLFSMPLVRTQACSIAKETSIRGSDRVMYKCVSVCDSPAVCHRGS